MSNKFVILTFLCLLSYRSIVGLMEQSKLCWCSTWRKETLRNNVTGRKLSEENFSKMGSTLGSKGETLNDVTTEQLMIIQLGGWDNGYHWRHPVNLNKTADQIAGTEDL
jgi:hypothetical protein